jgi:protein TonB
MSYAQKKQLSGNRTAAIIIAALLQFALGYALVTGLAASFVKKQVENLKTFNVEQPPPPPEKPPPPPKDMPKVPPPPVTPPPLVQPPIAPPPPIQTVVSPVITPPAPIRPPAPPPPPPPPHTTQHAISATGDLQGLFRPDDYPEAAAEANITGSTTVSLQIGTNGRITGCSVISSSGNRSLDEASCRVIQSRARFTPAKDSNGNPTTDTKTQTITWRLAG